MMIDGQKLAKIFMNRVEELEKEFESMDLENPTDDTMQAMADNLGERHGIQWCVNEIINMMNEEKIKETIKGITKETIKEEDVIDPAKIAEMLDEASDLIDKMEVLVNKDDMTDEDVEEFLNTAVRVNTLHGNAERQIKELEL